MFRSAAPRCRDVNGTLNFSVVGFGNASRLLFERTLVRFGEFGICGIFCSPFVVRTLDLYFEASVLRGWFA